ncbi:MAG: hypothetical protein KDA31_05920 [Phycisphaerales bacterium]|nr:hypothetical protein [Phycisphaerales bacterium]MCB9837517.1 hypothetical protein [Phycisphaera sp.]
MMPTLMVLKSTLRIASVAATIGFAPAALSQYSGRDDLPVSQVEELDREGQILAGQPKLGKPALDCPEILERVPRSQVASLEKNADRYLVMPNGDVIDVYRAMALRELEDRIRTVSGGARERLEREYDSLAPQGPIAVRYADGSISYNPDDKQYAQEDDTVFDFSSLPPLYELPIRPQPETTAAFVLLGSKLDSIETYSFRVIQQTDHWLIGYVEKDHAQVSQRIAVHRTGARFAGGVLEQSCVLWPLSKTAESRREYWDRSPLPLYVPLYYEDIRARPAELACAVEQGRASLRNHTFNSDRTRSVTRVTEPSDGSGFVKRARTYGPWEHTITWRSTPVTLRVVSYDDYKERQAERLDREDQAVDDSAPAPEVTHVIDLADGRTLRGRLTSEPDSDPILFTVVVGPIEQEMRFTSRQVVSVREVE